MKRKINVKNTEIVLFRKNQVDYISLTDIARYKNADDPRFVIQNWMKTRYTVDFLGFWEQIHNENFNRVEFDTFKNEAGTNAFVLTPQKWIEKTKAIGVISKSGRYGGGTYAHKDIAFEFASWISAEFKLYLIKEFQRLKEEENEKKSLGWDLRRNLAKINYKIHTDAIKENLIPSKISKNQENMIYANEADVLNVALFGMTAKDWRDKNPGKEGNIRDYSLVEQLVCLSNLESMNALFIKQGMAQKKRLQALNEIAIDQMKTLLGQGNSGVKKLK
ncbi:MAG: KilA-N domain-containing protein [Candidatus Moranbacteria bacterium]|nr:KilA-N domain-containing protein [Candidatus Moranbacteria bacterium]